MRQRLAVVKKKSTFGSRQYGSPVEAPPDYGSSARPYGDTGGEPKTKKENPSPSSSVVSRFHANDDVDVRGESHHHTLGPKDTQSSPGNHVHDGGTSKKILDGYIIVGSKASPSTVLPSLLAAMVRLGAKDNTT